MRQESYDHFLYGERYLIPNLLQNGFIICGLLKQIKSMLFLNLQKMLLMDEEPKVIIFLLMQTGFSSGCSGKLCKGTNEMLYAPFSAGCQSIGVLAYAEMIRNFRGQLSVIPIFLRLYSSTFWN